MSERYQVQFLCDNGTRWETIIRPHSELTDIEGNIFSLPYAFELLGKEMAADPDMEHRIIRYAEEVIIQPKMGEQQ